MLQTNGGDQGQGEGVSCAFHSLLYPICTHPLPGGYSAWDPHDWRPGPQTYHGNIREYKGMQWVLSPWGGGNSRDCFRINKLHRVILQHCRIVDSNRRDCWEKCEKNLTKLPLPCRNCQLCSMYFYSPPTGAAESILKCVGGRAEHKRVSSPKLGGPGHAPPRKFVDGWKCIRNLEHFTFLWAFRLLEWVRL